MVYVISKDAALIIKLIFNGMERCNVLPVLRFNSVRTLFNLCDESIQIIAEMQYELFDLITGYRLSRIVWAMEEH